MSTRWIWDGNFIIAKFYWFLILQNDGKFIWQKTTPRGISHGMRTVYRLCWMKIWKRSRRVCWTKITIIYNIRNVYQTKDIQSWSESYKSVQVWIIKKSFNCTLAHNCCKSTAENFGRHVTDATLSAFPRCGCLRISSSWICGDDCWRVSQSRDRKHLSKDWSRLRFSSKYSTPWWIFCKYRTVGISRRWFPRPHRP